VAPGHHSNKKKDGGEAGKEKARQEGGLTFRRGKQFWSSSQDDGIVHVVNVNELAFASYVNDKIVAPFRVKSEFPSRH
jgi:hypothetical protein